MTPCVLSSVVVLPTYNEVENIGATLEGLMQCHPALEVLVVDDSSPDGTALIAEEMAGKHLGRVHVLHNAHKSGLGAAYRAGFFWAMERSYEVIVQMDADGSHPVERVPEMLSLIESGAADVVFGSRYISGGATRNWSLRRRLLSRMANLYARKILDVDQRDLTGGFRAWGREALATVGPGALTTNGYGFLVEMTAAAHRRGLRVVEIPITFVDRVYGSSKMNGSIALEGLLMVWHLRASGRPLVDAQQPALVLAS